MWNYVNYFIVFHVLQSHVNALWDSDTLCPMTCTCRLEHLGETAIYRFMQTQKETQLSSETDELFNNDVLYEDDFDSDFAADNPLLRTATCLLQTETEPRELLGELPKDIQSLTLIQGAGSGNKSIKFGNLERFDQLIIVELHGTNMLNEINNSSFFCELDTPLHSIKYLNLDKVLLQAPKRTPTKFSNEIHDDVEFEYTQQLNSILHPLTMVQADVKPEILPYNKYKEQENDNKIPLFIGFTNMILLRISSCQLNNINWEMFDGLHNLEYLILEKNSLMFVPDFAFYGTPNLKTLSLAGNNLLNIQITDLAGLLELEYLDLSRNNFSQLSELSFPPFPKLKLANFENNPISVVFPSTFEVMNTTDSLILGGNETPLSLIANSFLGLKSLRKLKLQNLIVPLLKRELLVGMPNLDELIMSGNVSKFDFDAFLDIFKLDKLIASHCNLQNISMDAFIGLEKLEILDLSHNDLQRIQPGTFDPLKNLKELYLNDNKLSQLPRGIFSQVHGRLIRLNENPWHCSCRMSDWKPMIVNKIKQKSTKNCDFVDSKSVGCNLDGVYEIKYIFDTRVAPKCASPLKFVNWNVFHVMRKQLKCLDYKPKIRKRPTHFQNTTKITEEHNFVSQELYEIDANSEEFHTSTLIDQTFPTVSSKNQNSFSEELQAIKLEHLKSKLEKHSKIQNSPGQDQPVKISLLSNNDESNDLHLELSNNYQSPNAVESVNESRENTNKSNKARIGQSRKIRKQRKHTNKVQAKTSL